MTTRRARHGRPRRGFTLLEMLIALAGGTILVLAGFTLLTTLMRSSADVMGRAVRQTEPQEVLEVLDPIFRRGGEGLPVDSGFGGMTVSVGGDTITVVRAMQSGVATLRTADGTGCGTSLADITPTSGCALVLDVIGNWSTTGATDNGYVLVITPGRRAALSQISSVADAGHGYLRVQWAVTSTLGYRANTVASGQPDVSLQRVEVARLIYDAANRRFLVDDPIARAAGMSPWELASGISAAVARPIFRGLPTAAAVGALRPWTGALPSYLDMTGVQLNYTQTSSVLGTPVTETRSVIISPAGLNP